MSRMSKAAVSAGRSVEVAHKFESNPRDGDEHHLSNAVAGFDDDIMRTAIPGRYQHLSLVVGIDQTYQIAQNQALPMTQPGTRQDNRGKAGIRYVDCYARGDEMGLARFHTHMFINARPQVESGGPFGSVLG